MNYDSFLSSLEQFRPVEPKLDTTIDDDVYPYSDFGESDSEDSIEGTNLNLEWLQSKCQDISPSLGIEAHNLYSMILEMMKNESNVDVLNASLVDIIGYEHFDFLTEFTVKIKDIRSELDSNIGLDEQRRQQIIKENQEKAQRRNLQLQVRGADPKYPHVFRKPGLGGNILDITGQKYRLPEGTETIRTSTYREVFIPAPQPDKSLHPKKLIAIKELDNLCQKTFAKYDTLNTIQSLVYDIGYNTNENMLICAPTGAGKTDVALLTMLNTIKQFTVDGATQFDDFKIVYVAPLKALAAEIVEKMSSRLKWLGVRVRELTGDMQLTRAEINATQVIVTTPEKWDVVTRKSNDDSGLASKIKLLIIDEVHLLHEDRGAVIESLVARTLRQVESSQSLIRIVGLSATLPNFLDVAEFLKVNPQKGLFFFDNSFRPCPLEQIFLGCEGKRGTQKAMASITASAFDKLVEQLRLGRQVMVFVTSRAETYKTAMEFSKLAKESGCMDLFVPDQRSAMASRDMAKHRNNDMRDLYEFGFGMHHAGMLRSERNLTERLFLDGSINVLCCTATLAWGVNLPAAAVLIKGTQIYDSKQGGFVDMGISDVIQIFGRAGRPQFEKFGTGILVTSEDRLDHYLSLITNQYPIESKMQAKLADNLNAEISLGTVTNVQEGVNWLGYTYLYVRMRKAPLKYGLTRAQVEEDPHLGTHREKLIVEAARLLQDTQMIVFDEENSQSFISKEIGRIASDFYLLHTSVDVFNKLLLPNSSEDSVLATVAKSGEFDGVKARPEEEKELKSIVKNAYFKIKQNFDSPEGKTNALLQAYISQVRLTNNALSSDCFYVAQNAVRILRAIFLLALSRRWGLLALILLDLDKSMNRRIWPDRHPLLQFELTQPVIRQLESKNPSIEDMKVMSAGEVGDVIHNQGLGKKVAGYVAKFPLVTVLDAAVRPITSRVVRIELKLTGNFTWDPFYHNKAQYFWIWIQEDINDQEIVHSEKLIMTKENVHEIHAFDFAIPIGEPEPEQLIVRVLSDTWLGSESIVPLTFKHLVKPESHPIKTQLLNLRPLPVSALHNPVLEKHYRKKFDFFNPMQTMVFHSLYNTSTPVLLGSPTGSGKTVACELAVWGALRDQPNSKIVYIAPMKALVKERVQDWSRGICKTANLKLVELTGDTNPDPDLIRKANIIITTPEKFDGISRNWQTRKFVQAVSLIIMDEVHLLASDRGAILEMIVSRMNFVRQKVEHEVRLMGMSTAVANAGDMASWLGVRSNAGLFNFPSSVRPVPLEMYIDGFQEQTGFCPFMKSMNKPAFLAIKRHSPEKPVLVFVPSRRQTRLTAQDFIHLCGNEENPRKFLRMSDDELEIILTQIHDDTLRHSLQFGIAIHHAGLVDSDRAISHRLFAENKVQVLIATSTLAWGVNLPAYLVIVKGTQFYDKKIDKYKDMDLTDVLQMMGRAGRPGFDTSGVACVFTKQSTKAFYKYFLNIGFPVESSLHKFMEDHIGAEIAAKTITSRQGILDFLTWTFLYRRIHANPTYYGVENVNEWLVERVDKCLEELAKSGCITQFGNHDLMPTSYLQIASFYYLSHKTMRYFLENLKAGMKPLDVLKGLALASEYDELAIRHNEDLLNAELSESVDYHGSELGLRMVDPHVKAFLLVQANMKRAGLPIEDYIQDTTTVLDQAIRILQAMVDTVAEKGYFNSAHMIIRMLRCIKQGCDISDNMIRVFPGMWSTKSRKSLKNLRQSDFKGLGIPVEFSDDFTAAVRKIPHPKSVSKSAIELSPSRRPVYCPHFHKPQVESWFVIHEINGKVKSLERVQRPKKISAPEQGKMHVLNDTLDLEYMLQPSRPSSSEPENVNK